MQADRLRPVRDPRGPAARSGPFALQAGKGRASLRSMNMAFLSRIAPSRIAFATPLLLAAALAGCKGEEPAPAASTGAASEAVVADPVKTWIADHFAKDLGGDTSSLLYARAQYDLDGDGTKETLAYVGGPMLCGSGGCDLLVLKDVEGEITKVGELSVVQLPVGVLESSTNGWRDLAVSVSGGGRPGGIMRVPFDGAAYASNPTVSPAEPVNTIGEELIAQAPLEPLDSAPTPE